MLEIEKFWCVACDQTSNSWVSGSRPVPTSPPTQYPRRLSRFVKNHKHVKAQGGDRGIPELRPVNLDGWSRSCSSGAPTRLRLAEDHGCGTAPESHRTSPEFRTRGFICNREHPTSMPVLSIQGTIDDFPPMSLGPTVSSTGKCQGSLRRLYGLDLAV